MGNQNKINYLEYPSKDLEATKNFFIEVFGWSFTDYGPEYTSFNHAGIDGGFFKAQLCSLAKNGSCLTVLYNDDLEATVKRIMKAGGVVNQEIFSFPGGQRFHFIEPSGNEFAVWKKD